MNPLSIETAAAEAPHATALVVDGSATDDGTGSVHDLADLAARARAFAGAVRRRLGASADREPVSIALVATPRLETVVALHACWDNGWSPLLIHPRLVPDERARLVAGARPTLVADEAVLAEAREARPAPRRAGAATGDETPCAIVYTSGSAGPAKGVVLPRRAFVASARASEQNLGWRDGDRWLLSMPLAHVGGLSVLTRALIARRTVVLATLPAGVPGRLVEVIARHRVTLASLVPTSLRRLLDDEPTYRFPSHVRATLVGGAAASPSLLELARERGVPALTTYGMTEACSQIATQAYGTLPSIEEGCGPPLAGTRVRIEAGEIQVAGPTLMSGYLGAGGAPAAAFVDGVWLPTGDLGRIDERGRLHVLGRKKELIVTGAENVHPLEVEQALESCPDVAAACAFGIPDEVWGEIVAAAIVPRDPAIVDDVLLARVGPFVTTSLAAHRRPRLVARATELATNAAGKVDRARTRDAVRGALRPLPR